MAGKQSYGKRFEVELIEFLRREYPGAWIQRMTDKWNGRQAGAKSSPDIVVVAAGECVLIECKAVKSTTSIPLNRLQPHQLAELEHFNQLSNSRAGMVAVAFYNGLKGRERVKRAWLIPVASWGAYKSSKSMPVKWLEANLPELELRWQPGLGWTWQTNKEVAA